LIAKIQVKFEHNITHYELSHAFTLRVFCYILLYEALSHAFTMRVFCCVFLYEAGT